MFITRDLTINVQGNVSTLSEPLYLFQNDRNIDVYFSIINFKFDFTTATQQEVNLVTSTFAKYSTIRVLKPNGEKFISDKMSVVDEKVLLTITEDFIDEVQEIGVYQLQISLYDDQTGKVTIPPIEFEVLRPIFYEDFIEEIVMGQIDITKIGMSRIGNDVEATILELTNRYGANVMELTKSGLSVWYYGDVISAERMNKINENIDEIWELLDNIQMSTATDASHVTYNNKYPTVKDALDYLMYEPIKISDFGMKYGSSSTTYYNTITLEMGRRINGCVLSWSCNNANVISQKINNIAIDNTQRTYSYTDIIENDITFTIEATDEKGGTDYKNIKVVFQNRVYWGVGTKPISYNNLFFKNLSYGLSDRKNKTFTVAPTEEQYIYYAIPTRMGECAFSVGGFEGGFEKVGTADIVNGYNYEENYTIYKSVNANLGNTTVVVS